MAFPWPVTEDERLLTRALASAMNIYEPRGQNEEKLLSLCHALPSLCPVRALRRDVGAGADLVPGDVLAD